ncbi:MAG: glycosyltransferase family 2 protein, partial [Frankia sp.]
MVASAGGPFAPAVVSASSAAGTASSVAATVGESILIACVLLGTVPLLSMSGQFLLVGLHPWRDHYDRCEPFYPRVAVLLPAWNEAAVIGHTIDRLMGLDYPADALRVYVIDDASTDGTPEAVLTKAAAFPGRVFHLRRDHGGEGKAHTLNHGISALLSDSWMEAMLIADADVVYTADSLRRMTRHLADPSVGAVTAYITEGSRPGNYLTRFVGYEYITAQAGARRAQNVLGALACLAGGAQLHSRANLEAIGGRIDTTSWADDTFPPLNTPLAGRRALIEPNAIVYAEEP